MRSILKASRVPYAANKRMGKRFVVISFLILFSLNCLLPGAYSETNELKDVKPPVGLPETPWGLILIVGLGVAALIFGLWYWTKKKKGLKSRLEPKTPWEVAYQQLDELRRRDLFGHGRAKDHFSELSLIARSYIEDRFNIRAPEMTTEEFLERVKTSSSVNPRHKEILGDFLVLCDMVKFAKYGPNAYEASQSFDLVKKFVDETKEGQMEESVQGRTA